MNKKKQKKQRNLLHMKRILKKRNRRMKRKSNGRIIFRTADSLENILSQNTANFLCKTYKIHHEKKWGKNKLPNFINHKPKFVIPEVFSLVKNPEEILDFVEDIFKKGSQIGVSEIVLDFRKCKEIDLDASTLLDVYLYALVSLKERCQNIKLNMEGPYWGIDNNVKHFLKVNGLFSHFNIDVPIGASDEEYNDHSPIFELVRGHSNSRASGRIATIITEYIDKCLKLNEYMLTLQGKSNFGQMLGEVVNNCEIHSGKESVWHAIGHYVDKGHEREGEVQLVIFDIGDTIYESFKSKDSSKEMQEKFDSLCCHHKKIFDRNWDEEALATVFVLQSKISRKRDSQDRNQQDRGTGTIRLIEKFREIGCTADGRQPVMSIISGKTQILFSGTYKLKDKKFNNDKIFGNDNLKIIAFNDENDLYSKPDNKVVRKLKSFFPGTIITMCFYLDKKFMDKIMGAR